MATTSVPLMSDIEGGDTEERTSDIKSDFSYHNNVAGAPALIRKGFLKKVSTYTPLKKRSDSSIFSKAISKTQLNQQIALVLIFQNFHKKLRLTILF